MWDFPETLKSVLRVGCGARKSTGSLVDLVALRTLRARALHKLRR